MTDSEAPATDYDRGYERGLVSFIDILGYRALLQTRSAEEIRHMVEALRRFTAGDGEPVTRMAEVRLSTESFSESVSDAVVRVRTVDTQYQAGAVVYELIDLMQATISCVNLGIFIRGGLTIGPVHLGINGEGPIFGNAMVRAYEIESKEAVYPRIMIDEEAITTYLDDASIWQDGEVSRSEAQLVRQFIRMSDDGSYFLDYLRAADASEFDDLEAGRFAFLESHRRLISNHLATTDRKARRKLIWLATYHNTFIAELRGHYDQEDSEGVFHAAFGATPIDLFDGLMIDETWTLPLARLDHIAGT